MRYSVGIDLGSTTTKAVIVGESGAILGRGITNSRSNYRVACDVALGEALISARFTLVADEWRRAGGAGADDGALLGRLELGFREQQYRAQLATLAEVIDRLSRSVADADAVRPAVAWILEQMERETPGLYATDGQRRSDFFRDLAGARYMQLGEQVARGREVGFDRLAGLFDKAILEVENSPVAAGDFAGHAGRALERMAPVPEKLVGAVARAARARLEQAASVGTGYGRQTLPFPKDKIRSEILCHGLGAHAMFPATRTVLDIGGQDTKAIQVDENGVVTSFQMNDRCAAGCGRYLGYIADEMNLGVHQLGPLACSARRAVRINSTCTVFAGAELRERLSLGEPREDILAGLHRAIILRAMSLLARSGGVYDQFTFTGGVARNPAAVGALERLVDENYGRLTTNISPDSIYTGALGAALFARRGLARDGRDAAGGGARA
ncbi:MAG TPA: BadF/BadG/BcrA/BcrD ATPase family protein [Candidatus Polarisedimenticolaceae bacterium]|nr:BadF/BadG/BcrA/BcrD ATPase family protein [Candidatus Polarisedimenticolaceae bacterium]